jgi:heme-degrading monooxygenase HmoA
MPVIVVTRLRLSDPALFDEFFASAVAVTEQAENSDGNLGADVLADANNVFWTRSAWRARGPMQAFVGSEPHLATMDRLDDWCDEATFVDWEQSDPSLPDWQTGYDRIIADGQVASLTRASDAHQTRAFPAPVTAP